MILKVDWKIILNVKYKSPEKIDSNGNIIYQRRQLKKTQYFNNETDVNKFRDGLWTNELKFLSVSKCKSHQTTLLCMINELHSVKRDFCERDLNGNDPIKSFFRWIVDYIVKPINSNMNEKNDYMFVAHNRSAYNTQFIYKVAHDFFGYKNVNIITHESDDQFENSNSHGFPIIISVFQGFI